MGIIVRAITIDMQFPDSWSYLHQNFPDANNPTYYFATGQIRSQYQFVREDYREMQGYNDPFIFNTLREAENAVRIEQAYWGDTLPVIVLEYIEV